MMRFIGFYNYTVILTYMSIVSAVIGMANAYKENFTVAIICLIISGICDMFDGAVARSKKNRSSDEKSFGIQLDSLCDIVSFGIFPAVLLYFKGVNSILGIATLIFYILCAVIRLAYFNVLETKRQQTENGCAKEYRGLPVTMSAVIFPLAFLICLFLSSEISNVIFHILPLITGFLFILDFRIPKPDIAKVFSSISERR